MNEINSRGGEDKWKKGEKAGKGRMLALKPDKSQIRKFWKVFKGMIDHHSCDCVKGKP